MEFVICFIAGTFTGSFIGLCAYRLPRGNPVVFDFSKCDFCARQIPWKNKIPLLSFLFLQGKSACCTKPIPWTYPIIELVTGFFFVFLYRLTGELEGFIVANIFLSLLLISVLTDLQHRIIPNKITYSGMILGLVIGVFSFQHTLLYPVLGLIFCGGFLYLGGAVGKILFRKDNAMGGGDIKLAAMIGAFLGLEQGFLALLLALSTGIIFGFVKLVLEPEFRTYRELPFGPFMALGAVASLIYGEDILIYYYARLGDVFL